MKKVNNIINHPVYIENLERLALAEKERRFCIHNLQHFLDVARVAYIITLENNMGIEKEIVYAASLLHDIGRWKQYEDGTDHAVFSAQIAENILMESGFEPEEVSLILKAIRKHRDGENLTSKLDIVLYQGDKLSRLCISCSSLSECKRFSQGMGSEILY